MKETTNRMSRRQLLALLAAVGATDRAWPQSPVASDPRSYKVALENDRVRVLDFVSRPGMGVCGKGMHYHPAHVTVTLTPGKVRITEADGRTAIKEVPAGMVLYAGPETHSVENIGGSGTRAYIIELKDKDWKPSTG